MIQKYLGYLLVNSEINRFFYIGLLVLQTLQVFFMVINYDSLHVVRDIFLLSVIGTIPLTSILLVLEFSLIFFMLWGYVIFKRQYRKRSKNSQDGFIFITKLINYMSIMFRTILILPVNYIVLRAFNQNQSNAAQIVLCSILFFIYITIILPVTLLTYFNKFAIRVQSIAYPNSLNCDSITHVYLHFFVIGYVFADGMLPYINALFFVIVCVVIFWYMPCHYVHSKVIAYLGSLVVAMFLISTANQIINDGMESFGSAFIFILSSFCVAYLLYHFQQVTAKQLLLNQIPPIQPLKWYNFNHNRRHNQIFLYHLLNYTETVNHILIYFFEHQSSCIKSDCLSKSIFDRLKEGESKNNLFPQVKEFFLKEVLNQYNPTECQSMGQKEIQKIIHQKGKLSLLIIQLMIIKDENCVLKENIRKAYYFLKQHEHLVTKSPSDYTFIVKVEMHAMLEILEEELIQTVKDETVKEKYDSKAHQYFEYQEKVQQFKKEISHICDINLEFWTQVSHQEPDSEKIKKLIAKSHQCTKKVENMFNKLIDTYKRVSIIIYDTLSNFSQLVLNCELQSLFNPFFSLNSKYSQEISLWKKEKIDHINLQFTETYEVPVCMISADKFNRGDILWQNAIFRQEFAFLTEIKDETESESINIDQLILPFYRTQHQNHLDDFSKQQNLRYNHGKTAIFKKIQDHKVVDLQEIEIQVIPSLKFGLKLLAFIKKSQQKKDECQDMFLIIDEHLQRSFLSQSLMNEWSLKQHTDEQINTIIESIFLKNKQWPKLLSDCQMNKTLKLDMDQSDYQITLIKVVIDNSKGVRYFYFDIKDMLIQASPYEKALQQNPHAASCLQVFMQNTAKSLDSAKLQSQGTGKLFTNLQSELKDNQMQIPFTMNQITEQKTQQQVLLESIFQTMSQPTTPKKIITWRIITVIIIVLIMGCMIANMIITTQRQTVYQQNISTIEDYNLLIQIIGRSMITLREYNYWAYTYVTGPYIPFYQNQLKLYKTTISRLLHTVSQTLNGIWTAYDFRQSGKLVMVNQTEFVVVANYLLSSITYLADQPQQSMSFPFLDSEFFWYFGMTKSQSNYLNAVYNGLYVALSNMLKARLTLTQRVQQQIMSIVNQLYIIPTIIGILLLVVFIIFSFVIEIKSNKLIKQTAKILQTITLRDKKIKIEQIKKFKEMFICSKFDDNKSHQMSQQDHSQQSHTQNKQDTIMTESQQIIDYSSPASNTTDRQLKFNNSNNPKLTNNDNVLNKMAYNKSSLHRRQAVLQSDQIISNQKKRMKPHEQLIINTIEQQNQTVKLSVQSNNKITLLFYVCVVTPFLAYFITIFCGGYYMNSKIMSYIYYGSQMYHLSSYQQYIYLYTRETFLYQRIPVDPNFSWGGAVIPGMLKIYDSSRYVQSQFNTLDQTSRFAQTKITLDKGNLCDYLYMFQQQSIYYNITFTRTQCQAIGNHILTKGYKSAFVFFVQSSVQLLTRNMNPQKLTRAQRVAYLSGSQLQNMKTMLGYFEQFYKILNEQFQQNMDQIIAYYILLVDVVSIILIVSLLLIIKAVNYRWMEMKNQSLHVQSILRLISFKQIKEDKCLRDKFLEIDYQFYQ